MNTNLLPSSRVSVEAVLNPVSISVGTSSTGWIDMSQLAWLTAIIQTGVLGSSATLDAKFEQATSSGGAGAKDVTGAAITQLVKASNDNDQAIINLSESDLDVANDFTYARLTLTVGTAASIASAVVLGFDASYGPRDHIASVVEVVS